MTIAKNKVVSIHYTLTNAQGKVLDSSGGQEPLAYVHGLGNIIPGLEKALEGKKTGDKVQAVIAPAEAYGEHHDELIQQVPASEFPSDMQVQVGDQFQIETPDGYRIATVKSIATEHVTIDLNHPLAGETLHFEVEVGEIRPATEEELSHGHVHGEGGHSH